MSKTTSAVAVIGTDLTTVFVWFLSHAIPMAVFKHAPGYAGIHPHVVELLQINHAANGSYDCEMLKTIDPGQL